MTVIERVVAAPTPVATAGRSEWSALLLDLARDLDRGRIYRRQLPDLATALDRVLDALARSDSRL